MNEKQKPAMDNPAVQDSEAAQPAEIGALKKFTDRIGPLFGTEDFCFFLYSLVKMHRPAIVLEVGTGCGAAALWLAQAVKENGTGHVWTIDDGSEWSLLLQAPACPLLPEERKESHAAFFNDVLDRFGLAPQVTFIPRKVPPFPRIDGKIDLLFSDFLHGPNMILSLLGYFLPRMSRASSILIDSASTAFPSYALLEILIGQLNDGKLPQALLEMTHEDDRAAVTDFVRSSRFTLVHLTETKNRRQNSTTWIKIEPIDLRPHPATAWH